MTENFIVERNFPLWKFWKWRRYRRTRKEVEKFLKENNEGLSKAIYKAHNDVLIFGTANVDWRHYEND